MFAKTESSRLYLKSGLEVKKQPVVEEDPVLSAHDGLGVLVRADCYAGQTVHSGESCTYPGTSFIFSVAADGRGTFWVSSAAKGGTIDSRNSTLNGISVNFLAIGNADGSWFLQEVGDDVVGTAGVTVSETALTVTEEDATGDTYTVVLDSEPTANVVVTVAGHSGTDVTPAPVTLTFTNLNWETAQTVTVTAGNDADTANDSVSLTHRATSTDSDYNGISITGVTVTVNDNDTGPTTGICGRTEEVRDGILARISGVTDCADVTDVHLAAITGRLDLDSEGLTALAAGDFDGLTALTSLWLGYNDLTTLPDDVFDELTALTSLHLLRNSLTELPDGVFDELTALTSLDLRYNSLTELPDGVFDNNTALDELLLTDNSLSTLPDGVFDGLTALTWLWLEDNDLTTLPDGVFEDLTALTWLNLHDNPEAPFSPTADALPDDGTVSSAGGDVTLDGSGSGGAWGTNVFYSWALTSPASGVTVRFQYWIATPVVTIPVLTGGTELTFTLTVTGRGERGDTDGIAPATDAARVTVEAALVNAAPSFTSPEAFNAAENQTAVGTVAASDSDGGDSVTGYAIQGGADRSKFSLAPSTGVLTFASAPNYEAPADADTDGDYVVVVRATSGTGARVKTADQTITVTVTDVDGEAPGVPVAPTVSSASVTSVTATWTAPSNAGPAIGDYDYRYQVKSPQGSWTEVTTTTITELRTTITELAEDTEYNVQVRATNGEGTSDWSGSGSGSTDANAVPSFTSPATFSAAENQTAVGTVAASDSDTGDSVTGYAIHGGADRSKFSIAGATGALTFASAPNFEAPADADTGNDYVVVVRATSGTGARAKTADQTITVTVTDVAGEAPGVPVAPTVSSASVTSVTATWAAPTNAGPPITDYDYRHQVKLPRGSWTEVTTTTITALSATITQLAEDTEYNVQVRATNGEGTSDWSGSGSGSTDANASPSFTSPATFNVPENRAAVGTVAASDSDGGDSVTGYAIHGGADRSKFSIAGATGALTFASAPNFEAPADADTGNDYVVVVRAMSGTGARAKTADQTITVTVTDVAGEAPGVPVAPTVSSASVTSVTATWAAPTNAGPAITDYDYRHQVKSPQGSWTEVTTTTITALGATITQLAEDTEYNVQVRATNAEGTSGWSGSGSGSTDANASPSFTSPAAFNVPENQTAVGTVAASDSDPGDSVTGYAIHGGADRSKFSIAGATGALTFASAPNFEAPADADTGNDYVVVVRAMSGTGARAKTADQTITVTVTDVDGEAPGVPAAPTVSSASVTSVNVSWTAPANAGPAITDYDYRYRVTSPVGDWTEVTTTTITALGATITQLAENAGYDVQVRATNDEGTSGWSGSGSGSTDANAGPAITDYDYRYRVTSPVGDWTEVTTTTITALGATITQLAENAGYDVQVRATNDEGTSGWSGSGSGSTDANASPSFTSPATFNAAENRAAVGTVAASDSDGGDSVTGYAIHGGADADTGNDYVVVVRAMSGTGARAKTADQTITVTVTDVGGEAPGVPAAPVVSSASVTSVTAAWTAPTNAGPAITDYDYRHRVTLSQGSWTEVTNTTITALSATITQLTEDTEYDVQVRATNGEGTSGWSDPGTGTAGSTEAGAIANAPENLQATAGDAQATLTWSAPLNDSGADITGYAYRYKESGGDFIAYTDIPESGPGEANARSYTVTELTNGLEYVFHVRALNEHGGGLPAEVVVMLPTVINTESEELPTEVVLWGNYPNPFNPETTIRYALPQAGKARLVVYDLLGHEVEILVDQSKPAGNHTVRFGAGNLPSGLYVYRLQAQDKTIVRTMMLVK